MKRKLLAVHRITSLALLLFWAVQVVTGIIIVFRYELDDASMPGPLKAVDIPAITRSLSTLREANPGWEPASIWTSASGLNRFDVGFRATAGPSTSGYPFGLKTWRVDGGGTILRERGQHELVGKGAIYDTLVTIHLNLFMGAAGQWLLAVTGLLLLSNLVIGIILAWRNRGQFRRTVVPRNRSSVGARFHRWHRAIGLWLAAPAIVLVLSGIAIELETPIRRWLGAKRWTPSADAGSPTADAVAGFPRAIAAALEHYPGALISGVSFPKPEGRWYRFNVLQPGEPRRAYGTTSIYVDAGTGAILGGHDGLRASTAHRVIDLFYSVHTGEVLGAGGRVLALLTGVWLCGLFGLGVALWLVRRRASAATRALNPRPA